MVDKWAHKKMVIINQGNANDNYDAVLLQMIPGTPNASKWL